MSDDQLFIADELGKLADLRDRGLLSDDEFTVQKAVLLSPLREQVPRNEHPQEQTIGLSAEGTDAMRQWEPRGESLRRTGAAWLLLPASLLVGVGSLLPWLTVNDGISTINRNGFQLGQGEGFSVPPVGDHRRAHRRHRHRQSVSAELDPALSHRRRPRYHRCRCELADGHRSLYPASEDSVPGHQCFCRLRGHPRHRRRCCGRSQRPDGVVRSKT
jgi:hypothetical protein